MQCNNGSNLYYPRVIQAQYFSYLFFFFLSTHTQKIHILLKDQSVPFPLRAGVSQG